MERSQLFTRAHTALVVAGALALAGLSPGCGRSQCNSATPTAPCYRPPDLLTVRTVSPSSGSVGSEATVTISGTGFQNGATVTFDGAATRVVVLNSTLISARTPVHAAGTVDVVVSNPGGQAATLTGGFTFESISLTGTPSVVPAGGQLSVSWTVPVKRTADGDWIGLFKIGDPNEAFGWWAYVNNASSGTLTLTAPAEPGQYEFRYLVDDGFVDVARSDAVTVTANYSAALWVSVDPRLPGW